MSFAVLVTLSDVRPNLPSNQDVGSSNALRVNTEQGDEEESLSESEQTQGRRVGELSVLWLSGSSMASTGRRHGVLLLLRLNVVDGSWARHGEYLFWCFGGNRYQSN
jgi:hypothetical protein